MEEITIWHNNRCGKSRDAKKLLDEQNVPHRTFEYMKESFTKEDIKALIRMLEINDVKEMLRPTETLYKELDIVNKTEEEIIDLLISNTKLIQRPIIIKNKKAVIARPLENLIQLLGK
jgi:arsenate reductase